MFKIASFRDGYWSALRIHECPFSKLCDGSPKKGLPDAESLSFFNENGAGGGVSDCVRLLAIPLGKPPVTPYVDDPNSTHVTASCQRSFRHLRKHGTERAKTESERPRKLRALGRGGLVWHVCEVGPHARDRQGSQGRHGCAERQSNPAASSQQPAAATRDERRATNDESRLTGDGCRFLYLSLIHI